MISTEPQIQHMYKTLPGKLSSSLVTHLPESRNWLDHDLPLMGERSFRFVFLPLFNFFPERFCFSRVNKYKAQYHFDCRR